MSSQSVETWNATIVSTMKKRPFYKLVVGSLLFVAGIFVGVTSNRMITDYGSVNERHLMDKDEPHGCGSGKNDTSDGWKKSVDNLIKDFTTITVAQDLFG